MTPHESPLDDIKIGEITAQWAKSNEIKTKYFKSIESTNTKAKIHAFNEDELENDCVLYIADEQTQGRGRYDRAWSSPPLGKSLLSTWSFRVDAPPHPLLTLKVGMALHNALTATWSFIPFYLKAPNDIYIASKKVAGVLIETVSQGDEHRLIIGIGLNVFGSPPTVPTSTDILHNLKKTLPLLGEDWIAFVDRLFFELTLLLPTAHEDFNSTQKANLLNLVNDNPGVIEKFNSFDEVLKTV